MPGVVLAEEELDPLREEARLQVRPEADVWRPLDRRHDRLERREAVRARLADVHLEPVAGEAGRDGRARRRRRQRARRLAVLQVVIEREDECRPADGGKEAGRLERLDLGERHGAEEGTVRGGTTGLEQTIRVGHERDRGVAKQLYAAERRQDSALVEACSSRASERRRREVLVQLERCPDTQSSICGQKV